MTAQSPDERIMQSLPLLGKDEKSSLLKVIESFLKLKDSSAAAEHSFDIDEYNHEIDEAEAAIKRGECYTHAEMKAEFAKWKKSCTA